MAMTFLAIGLAGFALGLLLRIYMGREAEDHLRSDEVVRFEALRGPLPQNACLACPPDSCAGAAALRSPVFDMPWERVRDFWMEMIAAQRSVVRAIADPAALSTQGDRDGRRLVFIQHSLVFRFPDIITVEFIPLGPNRSSFAVYSAARYGRYDFGKNRARVEAWLRLLGEAARPASAAR
jgi:hypothetical protein